jgi:hypothetical protein
MQGVLATVRPGKCLYCTCRLKLTLHQPLALVCRRIIAWHFHVNLDCMTSCFRFRVRLSHNSILLLLHLNPASSTYPEWVDFSEHARWMFITGLSVGLIDDFLICFSVSYYLIKAREINIPSYVFSSAFFY